MSYIHSITFALLPQRWQDKITITADGCWEWQGWNSGNGYGKTSVNGKAMMAHRAIYERVVGPIPKGLVLDHLCRNRPCCNPAHVEPVSTRVNTDRGDAVLFSVGGSSKVLDDGLATGCPKERGGTVTFHQPIRLYFDIADTFDVPCRRSAIDKMAGEGVLAICDTGNGNMFEQINNLIEKLEAETGVKLWLVYREGELRAYARGTRFECMHTAHHTMLDQATDPFIIIHSSLQQVCTQVYGAENGHRMDGARRIEPVPQILLDLERDGSFPGHRSRDADPVDTGK